MPVGRPTKWRPEFVEQARKLARLGANQVETADILGVSVDSLWRWATKYPEFSEAIKLGKEAVDERVQTSLYHKAVGYSRDVEKIFMHEGKPVRVTVREHIPPDTTSMIFWLKNRRPREWRDKIDLNGHLQHSGSIQHELSADARELLTDLTPEQVEILEGVYAKLEDWTARVGPKSDGQP